MSDIWIAINDDKLSRLDQAVDFLMEEYCPADADPIWSVDYFRWKLGPANPAGTGYLTLAVAGEKAVGTVSLTRKRLLIGGKEYNGGEVGDSYSSARLRRGGRPAELSSGDSDKNSYINKSIFGRLASMTTQRAQNDGVNLIYGTPNRKAYPGWTNRLGYFEFQKCQLAVFVRPTSGLVVKIYPKLSAVSSVIKSFEAVSNGILQWVYQCNARRGQTFEPGVPSVADLDELWERSKNMDSFSLVRDGAYWRHRYLDHPLAKYDHFSIRHSGRLCGVVITRTFTTGKGRRQLAVVEWMIEGNISFGWIIAEVVFYYKDYAIDFYHLYVHSGTKEAGAVARNLFMRRSNVPVILADTTESRRLQLDNCGVEMFLGSTDAV